MRTAIVLALSVGMIYGQDVSRVFHLHHMATDQDLNEFATVVRTLSDVQGSIDAAQKTMSVHGTATQIAIAEFLFTELDRQTVPDSVSQEFRVPNNADDVVRLFFVPHVNGPQELQEIATTVRTVPDVRRIYTVNKSRSLAVRGTADQIAAVAFIVHELDQPADAKRTDSPTHQMIDVANHGETDLRVFYLPYTATVQQFQEVATMVRTVAEIRRVFTYNSTRALIVRGTTDQLALADWMVQELAKPVTASASQPYNYPDPSREHANSIRVFYIKDAPNVAAFQQIATQIRTGTQIRRVFTYNESRAIAVRGTEAQMTAAEQMLADRAQVATK